MEQAIVRKQGFLAEFILSETEGLEMTLINTEHSRPCHFQERNDEAISSLRWGRALLGRFITSNRFETRGRFNSRTSICRPHLRPEALLLDSISNRMGNLIKNAALGWFSLDHVQVNSVDLSR